MVATHRHQPLPEKYLKRKFESRTKEAANTHLPDDYKKKKKNSGAVIIACAPLACATKIASICLEHATTINC